MATLEQILRSRDERAEHQRELLGAHPGQTLVCLTVVMPGSVKRSAESLLIAGAAMHALIEEFGSSGPFLETRDLPTGYEAYLLTSASVQDAKRAVCRIEEEHPLGRLFDIDVIAAGAAPLSRESLGLEPRRCLLCGRPARECMREGRHGYDELQARISEMVKHYVEQV